MMRQFYRFDVLVLWFRTVEALGGSGRNSRLTPFRGLMHDDPSPVNTLHILPRLPVCYLFGSVELLVFAWHK